MHSAEFFVHVTDQHLLDPKDDRLEQILGWKAFDLFRQPVEFLFPPDAHNRVQKLFTSDNQLNHIVFPRVPLRYHAGGYINFDMTIELVPESAEGDLWKVSFFKPGQGDSDKPIDLPAQDMVTFFDFIQDVIDSPYDGKMDVAMVEVSGLKEESGLDDKSKDALRREVESELKKHAMGGRIGQIDQATYSLLTQGDFEEELFSEELSAAAKSLNIDPDSLGVRSRTVAIDDKSMPKEEVRQALGQVAKGFTGEIEDDPSLHSLSAVVSGIQHHRAMINKALGSYEFRAGKRLVSVAATGQRHTILFEGKVSIDGRLRLPDELINMVDHADLALKHDLAQLEEIFRVKAHNPKLRQERIFYNLCRASLLSPDFEEELMTASVRYKIEPGTIGFVIYGLPPIKRGGPHWDKIQLLHELGFKLWIDRFGDAVLDENLGDLLQDGMIEMPKSLLKKLSDHYDGKELIQKLVKIWTDKSVFVVSKDFTEEKYKRQSLECGIEIYLSNDPMVD